MEKFIEVKSLDTKLFGLAVQINSFNFNNEDGEEDFVKPGQVWVTRWLLRAEAIVAENIQNGSIRDFREFFPVTVEQDDHRAWVRVSMPRMETNTTLQGDMKDFAQPALDIFLKHDGCLGCAESFTIRGFQLHEMHGEWISIGEPFGITDRPKPEDLSDNTKWTELPYSSVVVLTKNYVPIA